MRGNIGVHQSHCCKWHGCKYGDPDCPVANGEVEQLYTCEYCDRLLNEEDYYIKKIKEIEEIKLFCKAKGIKI